MLQTLPKVLLVVALLLGQWLALTHDYQHPALGGDETCQVCLHAPNFHGATAALPASIALPAHDSAPAVVYLSLSPRRLHSPANSRAPPAIPA